MSESVWPMEWRRVALLHLGEPETEEPASDTDVVIVVLGSLGITAKDRERLELARDRAEIVMGIVTGERAAKGAGGPDLAVLREFADILAHVGTDVDAVDDVASTLMNGTGR